MRSGAIMAFLATSGAAAIATMSSCKDPTQVRVVLTTNMPCSEITSTTLAANQTGPSAELAVPVTRTTSCNNDGRIGDVFAIPGGTRDGTFAVRVEVRLRDGRTIVERRALRFVDGATLNLPIGLVDRCIAVPCNVDTTCAGTGSCIPSNVDESPCLLNDSCATALGDASRSDRTTPQGDASPNPDGSIPNPDGGGGDSGVPTDCAGTQTGAPWPGRGRCPDGRGWTEAAGPTTWSPRIFVSTGAHAVASPAIAADGTVYAARGSDSTLIAYRSTGMVAWNYPLVVDARAALSFTTQQSIPAIASDGAIYATGNVLGSATTRFVILEPSGSERARLDFGDGTVTSPTIGPDGTAYFAGAFGVFAPDLNRIHAISSAGAFRWTYDPGAPITAPAVRSDGIIFVGVGGNPSALVALSPVNGMETFRVPLPEETDGGGSSTVGSHPIIAPDGTIYVATTRRLFAVAPNRTIKWTNVLGTANNDQTLQGMALDAAGNVYIAPVERASQPFWGLRSISPAGVVRWTSPITRPIGGAPVVLANGIVLAMPRRQLIDSDTGEALGLRTSDGSVAFSQVVGNGGTPAVARNGSVYFGVTINGTGGTGPHLLVLDP